MTETAKITARDFKALVRQKMAPAMGDPQLFRTRLQEILSFAIANEASMDAEANSYFDSLLTMMADMLEDGLGKIADSPEKRKLLRSVALTKRKHHSAEGFLKGLGRTLPTPFAVAEVAKPVFLGVLQSVLDLLFDATRQPQSGVAQFAILSLLYWTVDELTVAFYLAERKYTTQSYSHLRSVYDLLDTAELFFLQPQWAEVWGTGDRRKILKELSPGAVRKKLGKPKFDATYSFLTEMGMHGTFAAVRRRVVQRGRKENRPQVAMGLGGVPWDSEVDMTVSCCILVALSTLILTAKAFKDRLHTAEVMTTLHARSSESIGFLQKHFVGAQKSTGVDLSAIMKILETMRPTV